MLCSVSACVYSKILHSWQGYCHAKECCVLSLPHLEVHDVSLTFIGDAIFFFYKSIYLFGVKDLT